jgi:hypothetical protein
MTTQDTDEVADLLPDVRDAPSPTRPSPARRHTLPRRLRRHLLFALVALVIAVGASLLLPVAGTLTVAALLTLLKTAGRARRGLAARRDARGPRGHDPLLLAGSIPWALVRSLTETALLAPLLLAVAVTGVIAVTIAYGGAHMLPAWAAIAAAYTTLSCLGPGSRLARRELNRAFNVLAFTPLTGAMTLLTLVALATTIVALIQFRTPPPLWPLPGLHGIHVTVLRTLARLDR